MLTVARMFSDSCRCARTAACLGLLAIALLATPVLADPAARALAPSVLQNDFFGQKMPYQTARDDSGKVYAKMWSPRTKTGQIHLDGGVFAPINASATSAQLGGRIGVNMGAPLQLGFMSSWTYYSKSVLGPVNTNLPGLEPKTVLATASAHLIPAMAFLQATLSEKLPLVPYVGVGAGYEWLLLKDEDFRTGETKSLTYSNWAWTYYAGVGIKLSPSLRLDGEAFYNGGSLSRDVYDSNDVRLREAVDIDGAGARVGLNIVY